MTGMNAARRLGLHAQRHAEPVEPRRRLVEDGQLLPLGAPRRQRRLAVAGDEHAVAGVAERALAARSRAADGGSTIRMAAMRCTSSRARRRRDDRRPSRAYRARGASPGQRGLGDRALLRRPSPTAAAAARGASATRAAWRQRARCSQRTVDELSHGRDEVELERVVVGGKGVGAVERQAPAAIDRGDRMADDEAIDDLVARVGRARRRLLHALERHAQPPPRRARCASARRRVRSRSARPRRRARARDGCRR